MNTLKILIDADMIAFECCSSVEKPIEWEPDFWTLHADAGEAKAKVDDKVQHLVERVLDKLKYSGAYEIVMCFTDGVNFRKSILPTYKANRIGKRKPICYTGVVDWVKENYTTYQRDGLEADDCMGILATSKGANTVIISGDKDFKSIEGRFYDYRKGKLHIISKEEADYWHLYQTLVGDVADNYSGCPSVGDVTAKKLLAESPTWETVVKAFEKKGLTEGDALLQARVARILRRSDYDLKERKPILWNP